MSITQTKSFFRQALREQADKKRAKEEKRYLKSRLKHFGVTVPKLHRLVREWKKRNGEMGIDEVVQAAEVLIRSEWYEERFLAVDLLVLYSKHITECYVERLEAVARNCLTWALIDPLAIQVFGRLFAYEPELGGVRDDMSRDENYWIRRVAVLAFIYPVRKGEVDERAVEQLIVPMFAEGEDWSKEERFFIRKAIGWMLRELSAVKPEAVVTLANRYKPMMSGLTYREATRKLPQSYKSRLV